jgi:hypothetical protein
VVVSTTGAEVDRLVREIMVRQGLRLWGFGVLGLRHGKFRPYLIVSTTGAEVDRLEREGHGEAGFWGVLGFWDQG